VTLHRRYAKILGYFISAEGERYLGGAVGLFSFVCQLVQRKVGCWTNELEKLSQFAKLEHATFAAFTHGLSLKWTFLLRVTNWVENKLDDILDSLEKVIQSRFIPALTGPSPSGESTRKLLAPLPARLGGLGLINPAASVKVP
jgi:hypothetical protein